jgi:uncharacterized protein YqeY
MPVAPLAVELKKRMTQGMKERDDVAKNILRLALGEIQTAEARSNRPVTEDEAAAILRKLVKSNEETLSMTADPEQAATLRKEIALLSSLLPKTMGVDDLVVALASQVDAIKAAKSDGQATGVAMKELKGAGVTASGNDVAAAVKRIRT